MEQINPVIIFLIVAVIFAFILLPMSVRIIRPFEKGLVERLGKFHRVIDPGLNVIFPFLDSVIKVDMREVVLEVPSQLVITKDNVNVEVDAIVYAQVTDPFRSRYEISNYILAATKLAQTNLRNVIGELDLDACLSSRDQVNKQLRDVLDSATDKWGVKVNRVELQRIDPPIDITEAMSRQMKAERDNRATILEAEAFRQARHARMDTGPACRLALYLQHRRQAVRQLAQRQRRAHRGAGRREAAGEAEAIQSVFSAIQEAKPDDKVITLKYIEMMPKLAEGAANKIFLPYEASGMISSLAALVEGVRKTAPASAPIPSKPAN